jgi:spore germination cell wall hydrolase CwlJ-like protein
MISDKDFLALCVWDEARGEPLVGMHAVAQVVLNRAALHYASDGTIKGTVLSPNQFSGFWYDFQNGKYRRVCSTQAQAEDRAASLLQIARTSHEWNACQIATDDVLKGRAPVVLPKDAVLYLNPSITPKAPSWATPAKAVVAIGSHTFYRA